MPSGAKKRKAAKKKLHKEAHKNGAHQRGNDDAKSHDEREGDGCEVEREPSEEENVENHDEGTKEVNLSEVNSIDNTEENAEEVKSKDNLNDVNVETEERKSSCSSSSSSSEDEMVAVEKEKLTVVESNSEIVVPEGMPKPAQNVPEEVSIENSSEEGIPVEDSVKQVVSVPLESNLVTESFPVEITMASLKNESGMKQMVDEVFQSLDGSDKISSSVSSLVEEKIEAKVIQVEGRENEVLLPQSSGVTALDRNGGGYHVIESEKQNHLGEQHLVSSAPIPVRRTSWMDCCGLFEVFSGGSRR